MEKATVNMFRFTVIVDPNALNSEDPTNSPGIIMMCNDISLNQTANGQQLLIPQGIAMIGFYLVTLPLAGNPENQPQAAFVTSPPTATPPGPGPITWTGGEPTTAFLVQSWDLTHVTVIDFNMAANLTEHPFTINITYGGVIYSQDPTIVNEPPMQPGQG